LQYRYCFAWASKAIKHKNEKTGKLKEGIHADLVILDTNFRSNSISSIVKYDPYSGIPYIKNSSCNAIVTDIDLLQVFAKPFVKVIFKNKYKSLHLGEVAKALLGYGKLENKTGADLTEMSVEERRTYCLQDAHIVAQLVSIKNGDILKLMQVIANHTGLRLEEVCHKGMTGIWTKILNGAISKKISLVGYDNIPSILHKLYSSSSYSDFTQVEESKFDQDDEDRELEDEESEDNIESFSEHHIDRCFAKSKKLLCDNGKVNRKYKGGVVLEPVRGLYSNVHLFDVTSLYPTMIIKYNLSPETVNCSCCKNDPKAKEMLIPEILKDCCYIPKNGGCYWVCQRKKGLFAKILQELTEQRIKYKNTGLEVESQAIKVIINSGYGVFGHPYFKYNDPRVAELVTAFGRDTLVKMRSIAESLGFAVLYGDTDSLFVNNVTSAENIARFIAVCRTKLGVDIGHEKTFSKLVLVRKKHYIGIESDRNKEPVIKAMEGIKSDRPEFIHIAFRQLVDDIKNGVHPIPQLKQALYQLYNRQIPSKSLAMSLVLRKEPEEYDQNCKQNRLGANLGLHKGDPLFYYKCDMQQPVFDPKKNQQLLRTVRESDSPDDICYTEYEKMFVNTVRDLLEILGYDVEKDLLQKDKTELTKNIGNNNNSTKSNRISSITTIANAASITRAIPYTGHDNAAQQMQEQQRKQLVLEGVDIILSILIAAGQQRIFPRTIMTRFTKGQILVYSKEQIIHWFETANYQDCRINAYPAFLSESEEQDYKKGINPNLFAPNILFIDLDEKNFECREELDRWLKRIQKNIANILYNTRPLVLWSGHGYHIILPVKNTRALEQFEDFRPHTKEPSKEFLQFAERHLSLNKSDPANNPSFKSCLLRVPYTFNSKCIEEKTADAKVKIVQQWDSSIPLPNIDNLLVEFQTFLVDKKLKAEIERDKNTNQRYGDERDCKTTPYVEKILNLQLADHRKFIISLILAPYFVNIQKLSDSDSFDKIKEWLLKCDQVKKLEPSVQHFEDLIRKAVERAKDTGIKPLKFEDTLQYKNKELYEIIVSNH